MSIQSYITGDASEKMQSEAFSSEFPPPEAFLELVATRFRALGEPMRLRIVHALIGGEQSVNALVTKTGANQANISRHLQTLIRAGILKRRKEGLYVYYRIADPGILSLCEYVCGDIKKSQSELIHSLEKEEE